MHVYIQRIPEWRNNTREKPWLKKKNGRPLKCALWQVIKAGLDFDSINHFFQLMRSIRGGGGGQIKIKFSEKRRNLVNINWLSVVFVTLNLKNRVFWMHLTFCGKNVINKFGPFLGFENCKRALLIIWLCSHVPHEWANENLEGCLSRWCLKRAFSQQKKKKKTKALLYGRSFVSKLTRYTCGFQPPILAILSALWVFSPSICPFSSHATIDSVPRKYMLNKHACICAQHEPYICVRNKHLYMGS